MISAVAWVRKGIAAQQPMIIDYTDQELEQFQREAQSEIDLAQSAFENAYISERNELTKEDPVPVNQDDQDDLAEFDMDNYDNEVEQDNQERLFDGEMGGNSLSMFPNVNSLIQVKGQQEDDPYIDLDNDDNQSEIEELEVDPRDNMIVVAKTELEISSLEVYIYESEMENLYVHHDIMLPSYPLCIEWIGHKIGKQAGQPGIGNYAAVGTFEPTIELWNLDVVDVILPELVLGKTKKALNNKERKKNKKKSSIEKVDLTTHTDAVMGLSWNKNVMNILASSSADTTVKVWDLNNGSCLKTFCHHSDKVQSVQWHPTQAPIMITGSYDKTISVIDTRLSDSAFPTVTIDSDVEGITWDIHNDNCFYTNLESGKVLYFDIRTISSSKPSKGKPLSSPIFSIDAHPGCSCSSLDVHPTIKNCIVTSGTNDNSVKIWNTGSNSSESKKVSLVTSRDLGVGKIFSSRFCPDSEFDISVGGDGGKLSVWDLSSNSGIVSSFSLPPTINGKPRPKKSRPIVSASTGNFGDNSDDEHTESLISELQGKKLDKNEEMDISDDESDN
ncbi:putative WD repeat-containing protein [Smittium mucronatum]|uniref:Putative WD repeat-containing protein n=1 Tax=Smittium mucronatum TaxID=133383 RepID=A0A1R0GZR4_9FUNG|nr:putative WD repeat-containing protein [Smittium mucronatum]